jgi:diguanylate cyclase (GGDEF)-like protein
MNDIISRMKAGNKTFSFQSIPPRLVFRIGLAIAIVLVITQAGVALFVEDESRTTAINDILAMTGSLSAVLGIAYGVWWTNRVDRQMRNAWLFFMLAMVSWALGDVIWAYYELIVGEVPYPSIADIFYLSAYIFFFIGIIKIPHLQESSSNKNWLWLDILIVMFSAGIISWNFLIGPTVLNNHQPWLVTLVNSAYPVGDLVLVMSITMIIMVPRSPIWLEPMYLMIMGHGLSAVADVIYLFQTINRTYTGSEFFNILFSMAPFVLMLSGLSQAITAQHLASGQKTIPSKKEANRLSVLRLVTPFAWLLLALILMGLETSAKQVFTSTQFAILLGALIFLLAVRQVISAFNNKRLSSELQLLNDQLEKRVADRTADLIQSNYQLTLEMEERKRTEIMLREREEKLTHFGLHDVLTGLPNRSLLLDYLTKSIAHYRRQPNDRYAILFLDFDSFKVVNDSLGHPAGDLLLIQIGHRLTSLLRMEDTVARLGGDEFVILIQGFDHEDFVTAVAERILASLKKPFLIGIKPIYITASIGMVAASPNYQNADEIIRDADIAMYEAKSRGKACYVLFQPQLRLTAINRLALDSDLRHALEQKEFVLHYQPIICLKTKRIAGFEALIRWNHPTRGLIGPGEFIPIAESSGFIDFITHLTIKEACHQLSQWQTLFPLNTPLFVSVNLSPISLRHPELMHWVKNSLSDSSLSPNSLTLEIVENALIQDADNARHIFTDMRKLGIKVSLDDFGIGYSSLGYINQYPIDNLKIDRSFIHHITESKEVDAIVRAIATLASELGFNVIAEGIETQIQMDFLEKLGCQYGQGFLFSKGLDSSKIPALLQQSLQTNRDLTLK